MYSIALQLDHSSASAVRRVARTTIGTYREIKKKRRAATAQYFSNIATTLGVIWAVVWLSTSLIAMLFVLTILLVIADLLLALTFNSSLNRVASMSRPDAIKEHLRIERAYRRLKPLRNSKLLFNTPFIGRMMKVFYDRVMKLESALRRQAYPHIDLSPENIPIQNHNPSDPWQTDDDSDIYSKTYLLK